MDNSRASQSFSKIAGIVGVCSKKKKRYSSQKAWHFFSEDGLFNLSTFYYNSINLKDWAIKVCDLNKVTIWERNSSNKEKSWRKKSFAKKKNPKGNWKISLKKNSTFLGFSGKGSDLTNLLDEFAKKIWQISVKTQQSKAKQALWEALDNSFRRGDKLPQSGIGELFNFCINFVRSLAQEKVIKKNSFLSIIFNFLYSKDLNISSFIFSKLSNHEKNSSKKKKCNPLFYHFCFVETLN